MHVHDLRSDPVKEWISFDRNEAKVLKNVTPPIDEQMPYESEKIWRMVTKYLKENDVNNET